MSRYLISLFFCFQVLLFTSAQTTDQTTAQTTAQITDSMLSVEDARIVFVNSEGQIATISADGSDLRVLSKAPSRYQFPAWSPDGSVIASLGTEGTSGVIDLFVDGVGETANRIYMNSQERPFYMYWSPDAQTISYLSNHPEAAMAMSFLDVETQESRARAFGSPFYWQWTQNSNQLFIHQGTLQGQLGFIEADGNEELTENIDGLGLFRSPGISASGDYIAYASGGVRGTEIILKNSPLSENNDAPDVSRSLPYDGFTAMSWSPAEDLLAFILPIQASMSSFGSLAMMDAETGLLETLTEESVIAFFWSPDGKYVMYLTVQRAEGNDFANYDNYNELFRSATSDEGITESELAQYLAQRSDIELAVNIIEVSTLENSYLSSIKPTTFFLNQFIPYFEQYALSHNVWSPDSQAIALPTRDKEGDSNIAVIYIEDGSQDIIAKGETPFWQH